MPSIYTNSPSRPHPGCGFAWDSMEHYRLCVPRSKWPASMGKRKVSVIETVVVSREPGDLSLYTASIVRSEVPTVAFTPDGVICDCGFVAKSAFGLRAHQRKHKTEAT